MLITKKEVTSDLASMFQYLQGSLLNPFFSHSFTFCCVLNYVNELFKTVLPHSDN